MKNFRVSFYKNKYEVNKQTGKEELVGNEYLGTITIDDSSTSKDFTLQAKAFRHASPFLQIADKVVTEQV